MSFNVKDVNIGFVLIHAPNNFTGPNTGQKSQWLTLLGARMFVLKFDFFNFSVFNENSVK